MAFGITHLSLVIIAVIMYFVGRRDERNSKALVDENRRFYEHLRAQMRQRWAKGKASTSTSNRPKWPEIWMEFARCISRRSYDPRLKVGTVIVSDDNTRVLAIGYNGNAKGLPNEVESSEPGCSGLIHAETNALVKCDFHFNGNKHLYVTHSPCRACAKLIIQGNISRVVYGELYRDESSIELLRSAGIEVMSIDEAILTA